MRQRASARQFTAAELVGDPLIAAIERLTAGSSDGSWCGTYPEALAALNARTSEAMRQNRLFWPQNTKGLSKRLGRMGEGLRAAGLAVNVRQGGICFARVTARIERVAS